MANTHKLFLEFDTKLNIEKSKEERLKKSRDALQERITSYFRAKHPKYDPVYFIQGSYKMRNVIQTKDNLCDLDLGVHFKRKPDVDGTTLQQWVYDAVEGQTYTQEIKKKCVRVCYKADYNIDLPVYAEDSGEMPILAVKNQNFEDSDPRGFTDWYRDEKSEQTHRNSKYLKAWGDNVRNDMLAGIAMTLLSIREKGEENDRDDISLLNLLVKMRRNLYASWVLRMPVRPYDNVIAKHDVNFRLNFFIALDEFIRDASEAIKTDSLSKASKLWRQHLGDRYPLVSDNSEKDTDYLKSVAATGAKPWYE